MKKSRNPFKEAIARLDAMEHLEGIDGISGKVYGLYREYLLERERQEKLRRI